MIERGPKDFRIIIPFRYVNLPGKLTLPILGVNLSNDIDSVLNGIDKQKLINSIGTIGFSALCREKLFFFFDSQYVNTEITRHQFALNTLESGHLKCKHFMSLLWLIKDCSVFSATGIIYDFLENDNATNNLDKTITNDSFQYDEVYISTQDIIDLVAIYMKLNSLSEIVTIARPAVSQGANVAFGAYVDYTKLNRIDRAMIMIAEARSTSLLPLKISFMVAALECLFTTSGGEVTHKVSERTAFYLSEEHPDKIKTNETVKAAYTIRSNYLHGQNIKRNTKRETLVEMSTKTGDLLRLLLKKAILNDSEIFLNENKINDWFNQLVLG